MNDQQSGGNKRDRERQRAKEHQPLRSDQTRPENSDSADRGFKPKERPTDDPSEAPESGTREAPDEE